METWIAAHTGLPSFYSETPIRITTGGRVLADGREPVLISDPLAEPGIPTTYVCGSDVITMVRPQGEIGRAVVTDDSGRGIPGLIHVNDGAPLEWESGVARFNTSIETWPFQNPLRSGSSTFVLLDPRREGLVWELLQRHSRLVIASARPVSGVPLSVITVDKVSRVRLKQQMGAIQFLVSWTEAFTPLSSAPVLTWAEYAAASEGKWSEESLGQACQRIAAMPWHGSGEG